MSSARGCGGGGGGWGAVRSFQRAPGRGRRVGRGRPHDRGPRAPRATDPQGHGHTPRGPGTPVRSADTVERDVEQCSGGGASDSDRVVRDVEYCGAAAAASERLDLYVSGTLPESDRDAEGLGRPAVERYVSGTLLEASVPVGPCSV